MLARGGSAYVYLAEQIDFGRQVAVKVLFNALEDDATYRRFDRECRAIGAVSNHPNIVVVHGRGLTADERPYLIMEHRAGGSLAEALTTRGRFTESEVIRIGIKIGTALAVAHQAGVLHRDVKPANILLSSYNEPALADFGIARIDDAHKTTEGMFTASVVHASREILNSEEPTRQSDVYALGSSLFELATGRAAFARPDDRSMWAVINRVLAEDPPDLTELGVSPGLAAVIAKAMDHDPARRHQSATELVNELKRLRSGPGVIDQDTDVLPEITAPMPTELTPSAIAPTPAAADRRTTDGDPTPGDSSDQTASISRTAALLSVAVVVVATAGLAGFALFSTADTRNSTGSDDVSVASNETVVPLVDRSVISPTSETTVNEPAAVVDPTVGSGPPEPLELSFGRADVGPLRIGEPYVVRVEGGLNEANYRIVIDNEPVTDTAPRPPPFFVEAGRHQLQVQAISDTRVQLSNVVEIYVAHTPPPSGYRANLSSIRSEPENWPEALRQFDQMVLDGHVDLKISVSNRTEANQLRPYWNYYIDGFGDDRAAAQQYCDDRELDQDRCFVAQVSSQ